VGAGQFRALVYFERYLAQQDSDGEMDESWVDAFAVSTRLPCQITPLSGRELLAAQAVQSKASHRLRVRYRPGFDATCRGTCAGTVYNVEAVIPDADSGIEYVTLLCSSGVNQGGTA
jgi:SPP1 family predicted phage head-tail adaptor